MRILLVYPTSRERYRKGFSPPLNTAQIAAITPAVHEVVIVNDAIDEIPYDEHFDLVGITSLTSQADRAYEVSTTFRERGVPVIMGGVHPTILPEDTLKHCDAVLIGDAETIWSEVLVDVENGRLRGVYRGESFDLETQYIPRWDLYDFNKYMHFPWTGKPIVPLYTTKGCPYGCEYCTVTLLHGKTYRHRPVAHVLEELDRVGPNHFYFFVDDNIIAEPAYAEELFKALKNRGTLWFGQASTRVLNNPKLIQMMADAGCSSVFIGVESINQDSLKTVKKGFNHTEKYNELFQRFYSVGIIPYTSFMFGFDPDTPQAFPDTLNFLRQHDIMLSAWWLVTPVPETPMKKKLDDAGRIIDRTWSKHGGTYMLYEPENFTPQEIQREYWKWQKRYYEGIEKTNQRILEKHTNIPRVVYMGSHHMQRLARHQVMNNQHVFEMGIR